MRKFLLLLLINEAENADHEDRIHHCWLSQQDFGLVQLTPVEETL